MKVTAANYFMGWKLIFNNLIVNSVHRTTQRHLRLVLVWLICLNSLVRPQLYAADLSPQNNVMIMKSVAVRTAPTLANNLLSGVAPVVMVAGSGTGACAIPGKEGPVSISGIVNTYYPATASVSSGSASIAIGSAYNPGSQPTIAPGDLVLVIQMQGATINATDTTSYGDNDATGTVGSPGGQTGFGQTGLYEYAVATNFVGAAGGTLNLAGNGTGNGLINSYNFAAGPPRQSFQVVRVPQYSAVSLSAGVTAAGWNGAAGGIVTFDVTGNLNFAAQSIDVSGKGLRGGSGRGATAVVNTATAIGYRAAIIAPGSGVQLHGGKGEGIAGTPWETWDGAAIVTNSATDGYTNGDLGRGAPGNAGGGGFQDAAGGGGANGGNGGLGGYYNTNGNYVQGGGAFTSSSTRVILGGGGGAGYNHHGAAAHGGVGGGLVIVRTGSYSGGGAINANGAAAPASVSNGAGGGAGGSVVIATSTGTLSGLNISASGGAGSAGGVAGHDGGGGGGGGAIYHSGGATSATVTAGVAGAPNGITTHSAAGAIGVTGSVSTGLIQGTQGGCDCKPALTVTKSTSTPGPFLAPNSASYSITVTNAVGTGTAQNVKLSDLNLPAGFTYNSGNLSQTAGTTSVNSGASGGNTNVSLTGTGTTATLAGLTTKPSSGDTALNWAGMDLPGGASVTLTFTANIAASTPYGTYHNPAAATYNDPTRSTVGRLITPNTNRVNSNSPSANSTYETGGAGNVPGANYDGTSGGPTAENVTIIPPGFKSVKLTSDNDLSSSVTAGDGLTWTFSYANPSNSNWTSFQVNDLLPANVVKSGALTVSVSGAGTSASANGAYTGAAAGAVSDTLAGGAILGAGGVITVNLPVTINAGYTGALNNQASATGVGLPSAVLSDNVDATTSGLPPGVVVPVGSYSQTQVATINQTTVTVVSFTPPSVALVKSCPTPATCETVSQLPGTDLTYNIAFTNSGGAAARSFVVTDPIPLNTDFKVGSQTPFPTLPGITGVVEYSNDYNPASPGSATWAYAPASGGGGAPAGYDRNVKAIRWRVTVGSISQTPPDNTGNLGFTARIR